MPTKPTLRLTTLPWQVSALHHKWLMIDRVHNRNSWQSFLQAALFNLFDKDFDKCQISYWWFIFGKCSFITAEIWGCRSVTNVEIFNPASCTTCNCQISYMIVII